MRVIRGLRHLVGDLLFAAWTLLVDRVSVRTARAARHTDPEAISNAWTWP